MDMQRVLYLLCALAKKFSNFSLFSGQNIPLLIPIHLAIILTIIVVVILMVILMMIIIHEIVEVI
jgi:hypothetical protein